MYLWLITTPNFWWLGEGKLREMKCTVSDWKQNKQTKPFQIWHFLAFRKLFLESIYNNDSLAPKYTFQTYKYCGCFWVRKEEGKKRLFHFLFLKLVVFWFFLCLQDVEHQRTWCSFGIDFRQTFQLMKNLKLPCLPGESRSSPFFSFLLPC